MKMIKNDNIKGDGAIMIVLEEREVRQFWLTQDKIDDGKTYKQGLYTRIEEGMRLLKSVRSGEIDLV